VKLGLAALIAAFLAHLLASSAHARIALWTRDRRLCEAAVRLRSVCAPS
jgi:hypothetical protein